MSWHIGEDFNARQENIKCVVVGDTAVGKTRLICARTCNASIHLQQMLSTHVPTVWAIDQYRIHKEVLRRSWMCIDGVSVALRLWDTFGDHEKDRKFAYGRADVVVLCFSISSYLSLRHCKTKWLPEIRQYCPNAPIVVVGCKNDLRHIYRDDGFLSFCSERTRPLVKLVPEHELVTREEGRKLANDIGAVYYESSVYTQYGVDCVFENAMRVALIARRQQRFWVKNLKNVIPPVLQIPYCPPRPKEPDVHILPSTYSTDMSTLLNKCFHSDVTLVVGEAPFQAHKIVLSAAASYFKEIFNNTSQTDSPLVNLTALEDLSPFSIQCILRFLYSGEMDKMSNAVLTEVKQAAYLANIEKLKELIDVVRENSFEAALCLKKSYQENFCSNLKEILIKENLFTDVSFVVDDGECYAHRCILMARCDVMEAMLGGGFKERQAKTISFPGVSKWCFDMCLRYLYTDTIDESVTLQNCTPILELADRLCLTHFITLIEGCVIPEIREMEAKGKDIAERIFELLKTSQDHNANQLFEWCQYYIITNYQDITLKTPKLLQSLHQDYQAFLNKNRWPPLHYLKEREFYDRSVRDHELPNKSNKYPLWQSAKKRLNNCLNSLNKRKLSMAKIQVPIMSLVDSSSR